MSEIYHWHDCERAFAAPFRLFTDIARAMPHDHLPTSRPVVGWDLGGVHVKAARVAEGQVEAVLQAPCALWRGLAALDETFDTLPGWTRAEALHAVTMTGELCDCFASREDGVRALAEWATQRLKGEVRVYAGKAGFRPPQDAAETPIEVASANWHASARLVGRHMPEALLVDVGSTTADFIPIAAGAPAALGYADAERLETGELVYTGAVRTPVMALAERVPFRGRHVALMAEPFATTADIYRLLGVLPADADQQEAADGRGKSMPETETRLARMVGRDRADGTAEEWRRLAAYLAEGQLSRLHDAASQVLSRGILPEGAPIVGCGSGRFIAVRLAERLGRPYRDFADLVAPGSDRAWVSTCAPAVAVALLATRE